MFDIKDLDYAIERTLSVHPDFFSVMNSTLLSQITEEVNLRRFTRDGGARDNLMGMESDDVLRYVLHESIKIYNAASYFYYNDKKMLGLLTRDEKINYLLNVFPCFGELQKMVALLANKDVNVSLYLKGNTNDLLCLINATLNTRFKLGSYYRDFVDKCGNGKTVLYTGEVIDLFDKVDADIDRTKIATQVRVNHRAVSNCLGDLMSGVQLKNKRNEYVLEGSLYATQDIGNKRSNQEDTTIILTHPKNKDFKFLAVSDGMGGVEYGDKASTYMLQRISSWFYNLDPEFYNYPDELRAVFDREIIRISKEIYQQYNADFNRIISGATFTGAIVTQNDTVIASVGDSRAYITRGSSLELLTRDESVVWPPNKGPQEITKDELDDLRFNKRNNIISRCIGQEGLNHIQSLSIPNDSYDRLMIFSDGVTDLLPFDRIKFIALNTPPDQLTNQFVNEAMLYDARRVAGPSSEYDELISAGKDNATATAYIRR